MDIVYYAQWCLGSPEFEKSLTQVWICPRCLINVINVMDKVLILYLNLSMYKKIVWAIYIRILRITRSGHLEARTYEKRHNILVPNTKILVFQKYLNLLQWVVDYRSQ